MRLGGGVAGLSAAHELIERGFQVTVYERKALGGKARTIGKPGSGTGGRPDLPGEHGFRFFPGFYHNLGDTMRRIPYPGNAKGTWDNLVEATRYMASREGQHDGWRVDALAVDGGRITGASARDAGGQARPIQADWFICAMPSERAAELMSPAVVAADPKLADIARLRQDWMTGLVFFLREPFPLVHGHVNYVDSPFA